MAGDSGPLMEWTSVDDGLPDIDHGHFLCTAFYRDSQNDPIVDVRFWDGEQFRSTEPYTVTHWMLLPDPPERKPKWILCLYCNERIQPQALDALFALVFREVKCPHCDEVMKIEAKLIKGSTKDQT